VLGLMQVYGQAAKPPMIALLPLFSAAASQQGPELGALPKAPLRASDGGGRGAEVNISGSGAMAVGGAPRPEFLAAYSDLRTAQVGGRLLHVCFGGRVDLCLCMSGGRCPLRRRLAVGPWRHGVQRQSKRLSRDLHLHPV
jgi:hypothetical protein